MKPDLSTIEGRSAYHAELRRVAIWWRAAGFALVLAGVIGMIRYGRGPQGLFDSQGGIVSVALVTLGWILLIAAIVKRTRHHKARMAEPPAP